MRALLAACTRFYERHEKRAAVLFFVGGVIYDFLTLNRIDRLSDNLILLGYLAVLALLIVLLGRRQLGRVGPGHVQRHGHLLPLGIQFLLGSLFSAYTVFYFASVSLSRTAVYFALLVALLVANEGLKERLGNLALLVAMYFFASFSFFIFFVPVLTATISRWTFVVGTLLAVGTTVGVMCCVWPRQAFWGDPVLRRTAASAGGVCAVLILLYLLNWIPPVPLSLRFGGAYHDVRKEGRVYHLTYVRPPQWRFWQKSDSPVLWHPGERVYCFASVFAPTHLSLPIYHHWERYDDEEREWVDAGRIGYGVAGGRAGGYRGFTYKQAVSPGPWRVDVETEDGRLLGRVSFDIVDAGDEPRDYVTYDHK